jgi:hypothetical protein
MRREDRLITADLHDGGVNLSTLEAVLLLDVARRCLQTPCSSSRSYPLHALLPTGD